VRSDGSTTELVDMNMDRARMHTYTAAAAAAAALAAVYGQAHTLHDLQQQ
jgi:hypothetical protein